MLNVTMIFASCSISFLCKILCSVHHYICPVQSAHFTKVRRIGYCCVLHFSLSIIMCPASVSHIFVVVKTLRSASNLSGRVCRYSYRSLSSYWSFLYLLTSVWLYVHLFFVYLVYKRVCYTRQIHSGDVKCSINIMAEVAAKSLSPSLSLHGDPDRTFIGIYQQLQLNL